MSDRPRSPLTSAVRITGAVLIGILVPKFIDEIVGERVRSAIPPGHTLTLDSWVVAAAVAALVAAAMGLVAMRQSMVSPDRALNVALTFMVLALTAFLFEGASPQGGFQMEVVGPVIAVPWNLALGLIEAVGVLALGLPMAAGFLWRAVRVPTQMEGAAPSRSAPHRALSLVGILLVTIAASYLAWGNHLLKALQSGAFE
jgi:hypothetical protein